MNRIFLACLLLIGFTACTDQFEEINTNPNSPVEVPTSYLITQAERSLVDLVLGEGFAGVGTYGSHYIQHLSQTQYTDVTRYDDVRTSFYGFYTGGLEDLENVILLNTNEETKGSVSASGPNANQIALAKIMQSWAFLSMTDFWGDIPYSEALKGLENLNPRYDEQEMIYRGAVNTLVEAGDMIVPGPVEGDIIYNGDMELWRKFANSIILRAGIRVSDVAPELGREWVNLALSRGVISDNSENAQLNYITGGEFANNTFYTDALTRTDYAISEPLVSFLEERNDPRLAVYAQPTANSVAAGKTEYVGMPYGISEGDAGAIPVAEVSFPGLAFVGIDAPAVMLTYSEVLFNRAEAAARGWIDGDAEELYDAAITASMMQHGISHTDAIEDYLEQEEVAYDAANFEKSIGQQKWIALYFQGLEAWSEWRRLGYPELDPAPAAIVIKTIPTRRGYPDNEFSLNKENYLEALQRQFGSDEDPLDGRVWWDVD
ncbi:SusD/RagB family nutrient-binding outer membrane lipoprotein [Neolewinella litorea]|uniref:SusD/RagB family nutrient-binding outer membrane lipoprotein n=1 Tax=Neolewinella litorea TaxID=2562452 RepID=A0A4V3XLI7_9BACT|nr:SusD/RagB family nutrient-binding outer membrane lipoprotein [Neolewinella litorea]THH41093.1 SusD/RagB family nutrient-binding outer membrane lipoprotein [Neolewinella litorea]